MCRTLNSYQRILILFDKFSSTYQSLGIVALFFSISHLICYCFSSLQFSWIFYLLGCWICDSWFRVFIMCGPHGWAQRCVGFRVSKGGLVKSVGLCLFFYGFHGCGYHLCLLFLVWVLCVVNLNLGCIVALGKHCQIWKKKATSTFDRFGKFGADIGGICWVCGKSRSTQENRCGVFFFWTVKHILCFHVSDLC